MQKRSKSRISPSPKPKSPPGARPASPLVIPSSKATSLPRTSSSSSPHSLPPIASPTGSAPGSPYLSNRSNQDTDYDSSPKSLRPSGKKADTALARTPSITRPSSSSQLEELKNKKAQMKLVSKGIVEPWTQVKIKWRILEGAATNVFLGLYDSAQQDLCRYDSSVVCHDRVSATSVMVAPLLPGYYTIRLIRDETTVLAFKTFQVISPLDKEGPKRGQPGIWRQDPETAWPDVDQLHNTVLHESLLSAMAEVKAGSSSNVAVGGLRVGVKD